VPSMPLKPPQRIASPLIRAVARCVVWAWGISSLWVGQAYAQPANDLCQNATSAPWSQWPVTTAPVSILNATRAADVANGCSPFEYTLWYTFSVPSDVTQVTIDVTMCAAENPLVSVSDSVLGLYAAENGDCSQLAAVWCNDDSCGFRSSLRYDVTGGVTYYVQAGIYPRFAPPTAPDDIVTLHFAQAAQAPPGVFVEASTGQDAGPQRNTSASVRNVTSPVTAIQGSLTYEGDVDLYAIDLCTPDAFTASTVGHAAFDTQLFLFDRGGVGVLMNDDALGSTTRQSTLDVSQVFVPGELAPGTYYLGIAAFNQDPLSVAGPIWNDEPFRSVRLPDGPGAVLELVDWTFAGGATGSYVVELTGTGNAGECSCPPCIADFNIDGGVDGTDVESFYLVWATGQSCGDTNGDGGVDGSDIEAFFLAWSLGECG
jgi:hypothetical protein